jgi:hypothetical protein
MRTARLIVPIETKENIQALGLASGEFLRDDAGRIYVGNFQLSPEISSDHQTDEEGVFAIATATIPEYTAGSIKLKAIGADETEMVLIEKVYPFIKTETLTLKTPTVSINFKDTSLSATDIEAVEEDEEISIRLTALNFLINWNVSYSISTVAIPYTPL